ncbi:MAG: hypothetical protein WC849_01640 [Candidatus Paceibacterota bacterium]
MSELFLNTVEITVYVCIIVVFVLLASYSFFYLTMKKMKKTKKEKEKKENLYYVADWMTGYHQTNILIKTETEKIIEKLPDRVKKSLPDCYDSYFYYIFTSRFVSEIDLRNLVLLCISYEFQKIKRIFDAEKKIQNKLTKVKEGKDKIKESEFLSYASLIQEKESERYRIEDLGKKIVSSGLLEERFLKEFREFLLLYNPEENNVEEKKSSTQGGDGDY